MVMGQYVERDERWIVGIGYINIKLLVWLTGDF